jgi:hypothetical protein
VERTRCALMMVFLVLPSAAFAAYQVRLTNGRAFVVPGYWEEDNQIRFYCDGGAVGIPRGAVSGIRECEEGPDVSTDQTKSTGHRTNDFPGGAAQEKRKPGNLTILRPHPPFDSLSAMDESPLGNARDVTSETGVRLQAGVETRKSHLKRVVDHALERFRKAARNRNPEEKRKAMEEMTRASSQLVELTARLEKMKNAANRAGNPNW